MQRIPLHRCPLYCNNHGPSYHYTTLIPCSRAGINDSCVGRTVFGNCLPFLILVLLQPFLLLSPYSSSLYSLYVPLPVVVSFPLLSFSTSFFLSSSSSSLCFPPSFVLFFSLPALCCFLKGAIQQRGRAATKTLPFLPATRAQQCSRRKKNLDEE